MTISLPDDVKSVTNEARDRGKPIVVAYADKDGQPHLSFRGSTHALRDDALAIWVRNPKGGLLAAIDHNPRLALMYRDAETRTTLQFQGTAHVTKDPETNSAIYEASPEAERSADPDRKGVAVIVSLDSVQGRGPFGDIEMYR